ncbi:HEAT repeat domain-containing protein [Prescottella equi]|uniref:HEAT repeat domain-containing protein n=1 Tax=Rhodococcus hoagii TaxID=43767 RepID=UPI0007CD5BDD|nr:HEAT repeat domain-containing protein [Prescottella equi]
MLIGEVSRRSGVSARMLRHYDALGLVTPTGRTSGGYREYSPDDIRRLFHVESLRTLGLSLEDTKRALDEPEFAPSALVGDLIRHTRRRIAAEQELLAKLERVDDAGPTLWDDVLRVVGLLHALDSESAGRRQQAVLTQDPEAALPVAALVEAALAEENPNVAGALQWSLARAADRGLPELAAALDSASVEIRRRATAAIASVRTPEATALLRRVLDDPDTSIRERAALSLGSLGDTDAIPTLMTMIVDGRSDVEAAEVLGRLAASTPDPDHVARLVHDTLDDSDDPPTRLRITQALAEIPGETAREILVRLVADQDRTVAGTAAVILGLRDRDSGRRRRPL